MFGCPFAVRCFGPFIQGLFRILENDVDAFLRVLFLQQKVFLPILGHPKSLRFYIDVLVDLKIRQVPMFLGRDNIRQVLVFEQGRNLQFRQFLSNLGFQL